MITLENLASILETSLNVNDYNIVFDISANYKEFKKSSRNKKRYEDAKNVIYGVLRNIVSEAVPVENLGHYTWTTELELVITTNVLLNNNLENVFDVLQKYYEANIGKQVVPTEDSLSGYKIGINLQVPITGLEKLDNLGGTIPLTLNCTFTITSNSYMFNDVKWYLDETELTDIIGWNIDNVKEQDIVLSPNSTIKKNIFKSQGLSVSIVIPHSTKEWFKDLFDEYYVDRNINAVHTLKYTDPAHTSGVEFKVGIQSMPISGKPPQANGVGIVFAEMRDDLIAEE